MSLWTDENTAQLRELHGAGMSCTEIGRAIGFTRNAVVGKLSRLGMGQAKASLPGKAPAKPMGLKRVGIGGNGMTFDRGDDRPPQIPRRTLNVAFLPLVGSSPAPWEERKPGQCCWPIDAPDGTVWSCCEPSGEHRYCAQHTVDSLAPVQPKANTGNKLARALRRVTA